MVESYLFIVLYGWGGEKVLGWAAARELGERLCLRGEGPILKGWHLAYGLKPYPSKTGPLNLFSAGCEIVS